MAGGGGVVPWDRIDPSTNDHERGGLDHCRGSPRGWAGLQVQIQQIHIFYYVLAKNTSFVEQSAGCQRFGTPESDSTNSLLPCSKSRPITSAKRLTWPGTKTMRALLSCTSATQRGVPKVRAGCAALHRYGCWALHGNGGLGFTCRCGTLRAMGISWDCRAAPSIVTQGNWTHAMR